MSRLSKRLQKLEADRVRHDSWNFDGAGIQNVALSKLSPADRDLLPELYSMLGKPDCMNPQRQALWDRWDVALQEACRETGSSLIVGAMDWEF